MSIDLEQQRKRAKDLRRAHAAGDATAAERIARGFPRARGKSVAAILATPFTLSDAQLVVAREAGFASWPAMVHALRSDDALIDAALRGERVPARTLHLAAAVADVDAVKTFDGVDPVDARGWTPLLYACCGRNSAEARVAVAKELLARGADANAVGRGPGYVSANVSMFDDYDWRPLEGAAARVGSAELIELLVAHGADAGKTTSLLTRAVQSERADVVRAALASKPPWWQVTWALCACVELEAPIELARLLVAAVTLPKLREPALLDAIRLHRDGALIDVLLGDVEIPAWRSAYRAAARFAHDEALRQLERRGVTDALLSFNDRAIAGAVRGGAPVGPFPQQMVTSEDQNMLVWALRAGRSDAVPRLLALGLEPSFSDADGDTPLHLAVRLADEPAIDALIAAGARADARDYDTHTPLALARALPEGAARDRIVDRFGTAGSTSIVDDEEPIDPATFERAADAVAFGDVDTLRAMLASEPRLVHARSPRPHRATLLHYCGANGTEDPRQRTPDNAPAIAEMLLAAGADPNATAKFYRSPSTTMQLLLTSAFPRAAHRDGALVEVLACHGARVTSGHLATAILHDSPLAVAALVAAGVPVDDLFAAAGTNDVESLRALLGAGADPNARYADGATALHAAATMGRLDAARVLLDHGADKTLRDDRWDSTPLGFARHFGHAEVAALLA